MLLMGHWPVCLGKRSTSDSSPGRMSVNLRRYASTSQVILRLHAWTNSRVASFCVRIDRLGTSVLSNNERCQRKQHSNECRLEG